jgi:N6-L-threonylcarbamoyladenine synthase
VQHLGLAGGVTVNNRLREKFSVLATKMNINLHMPELQYCTDNGVMIARAGFERFKKFGPSDLSIDAVAREKLDDIA